MILQFEKKYKLIQLYSTHFQIRSPGIHFWRLVHAWWGSNTLQFDHWSAQFRCRIFAWPIRWLWSTENRLANWSVRSFPRSCFTLCTGLIASRMITECIYVHFRWASMVYFSDEPIMTTSNNEAWQKHRKWSGRLVPIWVSGDYDVRKVIIRHMLADRQSWLLAGILPNSYGNPRNFCFDFVCHDDPIMVSFSTWGFKVHWSLYHRMFIGWSTLVWLQCSRPSSRIHQCCSQRGSSIYIRYKLCLISVLANNFCHTVWLIRF